MVVLPSKLIMTNYYRFAKTSNITLKGKNMQTRSIQKLARDRELSRRRTQFDPKPIVQAGIEAIKAKNYVVAAECYEIMAAELRKMTILKG